MARWSAYRVQACQLIEVDLLHGSGSEEALEETPDSPCTVPAREDTHAGGGVLRGDGERGDEAGVRIGFGDDPTRLRFGHCHTVRALAPAGADLEPHDRSGANSS